MKRDTLALVAPILDIMRANPALQEARPARFLLNGRDFLHFHEVADGVVADVRLSSRSVRMPVNTSEEQGDLLEQIERYLDAMGSHVRDRKGP